MTLAPPNRATHGRAVALRRPASERAGTGAAFFDRIFLREEEVKDPAADTPWRGGSTWSPLSRAGVLHLVRPRPERRAGRAARGGCRSPLAAAGWRAPAIRS